jgi:hypothetical protein
MPGKFRTAAIFAGGLSASGHQRPGSFTLDFADGKWHEIGELSRDGGQNWMKKF